MAAIPVMLKSSIAKPGLELVVFVHLNQISWPLVTVADKLAFIGVKFPVAFPSNEPAVPVFGPVKFKAVVGVQIPAVKEVAPTCDSNTKV